MKNDPYSRLGGLDQLLFKEDAPKPSNNTTTKQRDNGTTLPRDNEAANGRANEATSQRDNDVSSQRDNVPPKPRSNEPALARRPETTSHRGNEATRTRVSVPTGHRSNARVDERHSHDIFHDQVQWMNRIKLDIEETYGAKVTSNAIVQVALDLFIRDHELNGEESTLMRTLVLNKPSLKEGDA